MNKEGAEALLQRYLEDRCDAKERAIVESWYNARGEKNAVFNSSEDLDLTEELIWNGISKRSSIPKKNLFTFNRIAVAASLILMLGIAFWFYKFQQGQNNKDFILSQMQRNDIAPGRNRATLTLDDGKVIDLSDAKTGVVIDANKLSYNDGTAILKTSAGQSPEEVELRWITANTPRGGQYQFILPDGSKVWLNAASKLKFPSTFSGAANRKVELSGEAYFEISKDKKHPFIVISRGQEVEVLGTHFNINGYNDEGGTKTTVLEGSVRVTLVDSRNVGRSNVTLKLNQQAVLTGYEHLAVKEVDAAEIASWKNGKFIFNSEALGSIMKQAERWYNVVAVFQDDIKDLKLTGAISRYENISGLLKTLEATGEVNFKIEGNRILIKKAK
ncbi:FecR family protein [Pedobacter nyackensis]|uniref:FecR family protein n=2 Tax=Pedobacter nyackensis TaxID=475255 RepID=A0A1W2BCK7_9SPHI|nr:FecR family protein [Pedobacter nyackensis]